jgi:hypothetical protein
MLVAPLLFWDATPSGDEIVILATDLSLESFESPLLVTGSGEHQDGVGRAGRCGEIRIWLEQCSCDAMEYPSNLDLSIAVCAPARGM